MYFGPALSLLIMGALAACKPAFKVLEIPDSPVGASAVTSVNLTGTVHGIAPINTSTDANGKSTGQITISRVRINASNGNKDQRSVADGQMLFDFTGSGNSTREKQFKFQAFQDPALASQVAIETQPDEPRMYASTQCATPDCSVIDVVVMFEIVNTSGTVVDRKALAVVYNKSSGSTNFALGPVPPADETVPSVIAALLKQ
ncbi:MAG: hypothetical protein C5B49_07330 [Bdellovibrio sp.]|nr:MAG: hypothetical protein C5B49_07330 [Bdellovibrio sp.]